ncbi:MAG: YfjS/YafY family lipoprotein, partial [Clostridiales bacterium]
MQEKTVQPLMNALCIADNIRLEYHEETDPHTRERFLEYSHDGKLMGRLLNVNILNKAMGGSCMNEPEVADYFASDAVHFDAVLLENAINMGGPTEEYEKRTRYLLDQLAKSKPNVPVFFVTAYPHYGNVLSECACPVVKKTEDGTQPLDDAMRRIASSYPNAHVLEGAEMMNDLTALTCDGIHMSDYAHITTGVNLAKAIGERWLK